MRQPSSYGLTMALMTREEYEDVYRETLLCLAEQFSVGGPFVDATGNRMCKIDGVPLNDEEVLARWWGKGIKDEIRRLYLAGNSSIH